MPHIQTYTCTLMFLMKIHVYLISFRLTNKQGLLKAEYFMLLGTEMMISPMSSIAMALESWFLGFIRPYRSQMEKSIINYSPLNTFVERPCQ